jgi:starch synthase
MSEEKPVPKADKKPARKKTVEKKPTQSKSKTVARRPSSKKRSPEIQEVSDSPAPTSAPYEAVAPQPSPARRPTPARKPRQTRGAGAATVAPLPGAAPRQAAASEPLSILMVAPEAHPFAKTGGLAEVTAALTDALARLGHSVTLVLPRYRGIAVDGAEPRHIRLRLGDRLQPVSIYERALSDRVRVALVDVPELFDRESLYGTAEGDYPDNPWRFAVFSRAALEYPRVKEWRPSIIHAHDWQTGLVPVYQKMHLSDDPFVGGVPAVFTIHNLAFQGIVPASTVRAIGLGYEVMDVQAMEFWGSASYLKGGINFSEKVTTVSPGYAREIVRPELGFGLEGVLARRSGDLVGILNGIDTSRWTPSADAFVPAKFTADDLTGKREAKRQLMMEVGLPVTEQNLARPVIGIISRLTDQKGFDLIAAAADELVALDASWIMLGSGETRFEDLWRSLAARHPDRVSVRIGFDERLAHQIEAGSDMFLMPSRFEPCGLNQLYSLRYGTVPVVRATGGLDDTVTDVDEAGSKGTGFKFRDYTPAALLSALSRALAAYKDPAAWQQLQKRGMREDHSWDASAAEYVKLYVSLRGPRVAANP